MKTLTLPTLMILGILSSCTNKKENRELVPHHDKPSSDYNESADPDKHENTTISDYNTYNSKVENISSKTQIETDLDTTLLFQAWTILPDAPHASFEISAKSFYIADYDGDGNIPYTLFKRNLTVYYPEGEQGGEIISVTKSRLVIKWHEIDTPASYIRWKEHSK